MPRFGGVVGLAGAAEEAFAVEGAAVAGVHQAAGGDERSFGVEDEAVEVEDEGADHAK